MFELISWNDLRWLEIVKSFSDRDIYYTSSYAHAFMLHGDGEPILIYYYHNDVRAICSVLKRPISGVSDYFDIITPYGYGGFIFEGEITSEDLSFFNTELNAFLNEAGCVSGFFRYHPLLNNANRVRSLLPVIDLGSTVHMDLPSEEEILANMSSKHRNMIRKAQKNGVIISYGRDLSLFEKFLDIYNETMDKDEASSYYYFDLKFYQSIHEKLFDNYLMFYAKYEDEIIGMSIILFDNELVHYHLSGSKTKYKHLASTNLLLYEVALWGCRNGYEKFHLGGGVGSGEDGLYKFKAGFNKKSNNTFSISKLIFNETIYNHLVKMRKEKDSSFDIKSTFFPLYRA